MTIACDLKDLQHGSSDDGEVFSVSDLCENESDCQFSDYSNSDNGRGNKRRNGGSCSSASNSPNRRGVSPQHHPQSQKQSQRRRRQEDEHRQQRQHHGDDDLSHIAGIPFECDDDVAVTVDACEHNVGTDRELSTDGMGGYGTTEALHQSFSLHYEADEYLYGKNDCAKVVRFAAKLISATYCYDSAEQWEELDGDDQHHHQGAEVDCPDDAEHDEAEYSDHYDESSSEGTDDDTTQTREGDNDQHRQERRERQYTATEEAIRNARIARSRKRNARRKRVTDRKRLTALDQNANSAGSGDEETSSVGEVSLDESTSSREARRQAAADSPHVDSMRLNKQRLERERSRRIQTQEP